MKMNRITHASEPGKQHRDPGVPTVTSLTIECEPSRFRLVGYPASDFPITDNIPRPERKPEPAELFKSAPNHAGTPDGQLCWPHAYCGGAIPRNTAAQQQGVQRVEF